MVQVVIGTAGHIDHGKSSLVKSLTGIETDILVEEKKRGMTIDLGFAYLNDNITIIDVPGHEKFIKNMTAGASNIHYGIIVVAADDGIMPQTIEHIDILNILGVKGLWIVITKIDLIKDSEWIDLIEMETHEYLSKFNFKIFSCHKIDNLSGAGIDDLKSSIISHAGDIELNQSLEYFKMNVDRSFIKKGFGAIVTGTVDQGKAKIGDPIEILPNNIQTKIRGIQTHGKDTFSIKKGDRAAINLLNVKSKELHRGSLVASPQTITNTRQIIAKVDLLSRTNWVLKNYQRIRLHFGTGEILGRAIMKNKKKLKKGQSANVILKLESETPICLDDKFVIRSYSPMNTIGGGIVLITYVDNNLSKFVEDIPAQPKDRFIFLLESAWETPVTLKMWQKLFLKFYNKIEKWCKEYKVQISDSDILFTLKNIKKGEVKVKSFFKEFHSKNSLREGVPIETISSSMGWHQDFLRAVLKKLSKDKQIKKVNDLYTPLFLSDQKLSKLQREQIEAIESFIKNSGLVPVEKNSILRLKKYRPSELLDKIHFLKSKNKIENIDNKFFIHKDYFNVHINYLRKYFGRSKKLTVSDFKSISGLTRKTAIPFLEFLDRRGYTIRENNSRIMGQNLHD